MGKSTSSKKPGIPTFWNTPVLLLVEVTGFERCSNAALQGAAFHRGRLPPLGGSPRRRGAALSPPEQWSEVLSKRGPR